MTRGKHWVDDGSGHRGKCDAAKSLHCVAMRLALYGDHRTGISTAVTIDLKSGRTMREIVVYRKTPSDSGIAVTFCPFCGERIAEEVARC